MTSASHLLETELGVFALAQMCAPEKLSPQTALALVDAVRAQSGRARRRGLFDQIEGILSDDV